MWFKNLNFLQHLEHVDIIKFSNLLSALVSQDGLTIKGFFLKKTESEYDQIPRQ